MVPQLVGFMLRFNRMTACVSVFQYSSPEQKELGKKRYEAQKLERIETKERNGEVITPVTLPGKTSIIFLHININIIYIYIYL